MAKKAVKTGATTLDPMFFIPEGVVDLTPKGTPMSRSEVDVTDAGATASLDDSYVTEDDISYFDGPLTPEILGVVAQNPRRTATGQLFIDVVIEVEDIPGFDIYEQRVTVA
jgi:hypothetical protein